MDAAAQISVYLLPLLHASGALFALHTLCHPHSPQGIIAWILGLTLLQIITLTRCTGYAPCPGNDIRSLHDGDETYRDMLRAIRDVRRSILVQFFIIRNDRVGINRRKVLEERARAGVMVYVIYDEVGSINTARFSCNSMMKTQHKGSRPAANHAQGRKLSGSGIFALLVGMNRI